MANLVQELQDEQARLEAELIAVKNKITAATNPKITAIAEYLHDSLCRHNHTDACAWGYEGNDDWSRNAHAAWLRRATTFVSEVGTDDIVVIEKWIDAVRKVR